MFGKVRVLPQSAHSHVTLLDVFWSTVIMNLKLLFLCLFLAVLFIPAELKNKHDKHQDSSHPGRQDRHRDSSHPERQDRHRDSAHPERQDRHRDSAHPERHDKHRDSAHPERHDKHRDSAHPERHGKHEKKRHRGRFKDIIEDIFFKIVDEDDEDDENDHSDWLYKMIDPDGQCIPNPCLNNGVCKKKGSRKFECDCPKHYKGKKCERGPRICKRGHCGYGECILTSTPPHYECKCKRPFQPPDCKTISVCNPNPCKNGGTCIRDENDFDCHCPEGFGGRFCNVGPNDCYVDDGESYRGNVSETDDGDECLYWNSHFILASGVNPFTSFEDKDGLGPHNFCRNPDGESKPWCFFRRGLRLLWDYCDVPKCPKSTHEPPTKVAPTQPKPPHPEPTQPKPPQPEPTQPKPPHPEPTQPKPPQPEPTQPEPTQPKPPQPEPTGKLPTPAIPSTGKPIHPSATPLPPTTGPKQFATCGIPQPKKALTRIFGGLKVSPGAIPWQVSVEVRPTGSAQPFRHVCGGILIASCWVLTAAHCIEPNKDMQVLAGSLSLSKPDPGTQTIPVQRTIRNPNYRETSEAVYNDIGLLKLSGTPGFCANETQFVKTACLPNAPLPDGTECKISGWGATEQSDYGSSHLLEANVLLINQGKCSDPSVYGNILDNSMFCAGYLEGGVDSCQGDSGGPLTCMQNNANVVYGVVSWGDQCGKKNKPGVYTRVTNFVDWIKANTEGAIP
ncbi:hyaluronan-binding protein 2 [Oreochromis aureus]|uniref:trypsin n=1 Tax=Oreochromis aureus TaxID=47969 RepID=A0A668TG04_OREAU|nr:hyaluronan-binding protein 2 [Oreochromis aureus]